jgi:glycosyltransferase involved in cell wall biosynthesis
MNKIAVILPVYKNDKPKYLSLAVESILYQTYRDFHLYIGVDGPVGEGLKSSLEVIDRQNRVSIVWFPENRGLACVLICLMFALKKVMSILQEWMRMIYPKLIALRSK